MIRQIHQISPTSASPFLCYFPSCGWRFAPSSLTDKVQICLHCWEGSSQLQKVPFFFPTKIPFQWSGITWLFSSSKNLTVIKLKCLKKTFLKTFLKKMILVSLCFFFLFLFVFSEIRTLFGLPEAVHSSLQTTVHLTLCYISCRLWREEAQKGNTYFSVRVFITCLQFSECYLSWKNLSQTWGISQSTKKAIPRHFDISQPVGPECM